MWAYGLSGGTVTDNPDQQLCVFVNILQAWQTFAKHFSADARSACNVGNAYSYCEVRVGSHP